MTREEFITKYPFLSDISDKHLKLFLMFMMGALLEMAVNRDESEEKAKLPKMLHDITDYVTERNKNA